MRIIKIDASSLSQSSCMLRWKRIVLDGYSESLPWNDTLYGSSLHKFTSKIYEAGGNFGVAMHSAMEVLDRPHNIRPEKKHLNKQHLIKTCTDYWGWCEKHDDFQILHDDNGKPLVEVDFAIEYPVKFNDTIVILCGTIDKIGKFKNGIYAIGDYKTNSLWSLTKNTDKAIEDYFGRYELSLQFRFYIYCLRLSVQLNPDSPLKILFKDTPIGYFIDGVFLSGTKPTVFERSQVHTPSEEDMNEFHEILYNKIVSLVNLPPDYSVRDGIGHGACDELKFPCMFRNVCATEKNLQHFLLENFNKKPYDPLQFSK